MKKKTVWVVSKGEYSDRYIVGIASTKERAETMAAMHTDKWEGCDLDEYELDTDNDYLTSIYMSVWVATRCEDGEIVVIAQLPDGVDRKDYPEILNKVTEEEDGLVTVVVAEHKVEAYKKASDIFAKYRAEKLGL